MPLCRRRFQTTISCVGKEPAVSVMEKAKLDFVRYVSWRRMQMLSLENFSTNSVFIFPANSGVMFPPIPLQSFHSVSSVFPVPALPNFNINSPLLVQSSPHFFFSWNLHQDQSCRSCG